MSSRPYLLVGFGQGAFDVGGFLAVLAFLGLIFLYVRWVISPWLNMGINPIYNNAPIPTVVSVQGGLGGIVSYPTDEPVFVPTPTVTELPTITITPSPVPTDTPTPSYTPTVAGYLGTKEFLYSYFNPALGGTNCFLWDEEKQDCLSNMASGEDWRKWYGRAVACPVEYPFWTIIRVVEPENLKGDWICLDRGGAIAKPKLDFLQYDISNEWYSRVLAEVILP